MSPFSAEALLLLPVRLRGIEVGRAVDLIVDTERSRAIGLDVLCKDDEHRFLPFTAATVDGSQIAVSSALTMLHADQLEFYRRRASTIRSLRGTEVRRGRRDIGKLEDLILSRDGAIAELVVVRHGARTNVPVEDSLQITAEPRRLVA